MSTRPDLVHPSITQLYGVPLPTKRRALSIDQGQAAVVNFIFLDNTGNPVDLTPYALACDSDDGPQGPQDCVDYLVVGKIREVISNATNDIHTVACDVIDAETGLIQFQPDQFVIDNPGIYSAEFATYKPADSEGSNGVVSIAFTNKCFIWVDRGLFGTPKYAFAGPPTFDEVRLFIRDNAPEENLLLDDFEFDLAEICHGAEQAVRYWNEAQPPINLYFSTLNYPIRHQWMKAIAGHMFMTAAHRFRRNHLPYQAGGLSVDDQNKFQQYDQIGMAMWKDYQEWVKNKKVQLNCEGAITTSFSPYSSQAYQLLNTGV